MRSLDANRTPHETDRILLYLADAGYIEGTATVDAALRTDAHAA